jgi:hypothetical protein
MEATMRHDTNEPITIATVSISWTPEAARLIRAERTVQDQPNLPKKAETRGYLDFMLGLPNRAGEFSKVLVVSYMAGWNKGRRVRARLDERARPWWETDIAKDGHRWAWTVYREGHFIAGGTASSQVKAETAAFDARFDAIS